jgi:hypothetical protein
MIVWESLLATSVSQVYLLPLVQQQTYAAIMDNGTLVNAKFGKQSYAISVARGQTQVFVSLTLIIFIWCLIITTASGIYRVPGFSAYTEMDILGKVPIMEYESAEGRVLYEFHSRLHKAGPMNLEKALNRVSFSVEEKSDDIELQERRQR